MGARGSGADEVCSSADPADPADPAGTASTTGPADRPATAGPADGAVPALLALPAELPADLPAEPAGAVGTFGLAAVLRWADAAAAVLDRARPVLDRANVFPVPDADTGTNLSATLHAARDAAVVSAEAADPSADRVLHAFARGALVGARGSSGVILSEFLRGFAGATPCGTGTATAGAGGAGLARALDRGARRAVAAVVDPRPGTMLTAARGAADAALEASAGGGDLLQVVESARSGATQALRRSVDELDVLRQAGVLDAGAYGFVLLLDALAAAVVPDLVSEPTTSGLSVDHGTIVLMDSLTVADHRAGREESSGRALGQVQQPENGEEVLHRGDRGDRHVRPEDHGLGEHARHGEHTHHRERTHPSEHSVVDGEFELMCVVRHTVRRAPRPPAGGADRAAAAAEHPADDLHTSDDLAAVAPALRAGLQQVGDSVVVVGGADHAAGDASGAAHGLWQVHVHTDHPLEALRVLERWEVGPVVVRCLSHQVSAVSTRSAEASASAGVVACTASPGLVMDLARSGAVVVLRGDGEIAPPDVLRAVHETDATHVVVLPADEQTLVAAGGLADLSSPRVSVVGSTSDLHVVAALSAWVAGDVPRSEGLDAALVPVVAAVAAVRAVRLDAADPAGLRDGLDGLLGTPAGAAVAGPVSERRSHPATDVPARTSTSSAVTVLTVLVGDLVPAHAVDDVVSRAEHLVPGVEVVVLPSGRRSTTLVIGAEQQ